jgi:hypothetical protein
VRSKTAIQISQPRCQRSGKRDADEQFAHLLHPPPAMRGAVETARSDSLVRMPARLLLDIHIGLVAREARTCRPWSAKGEQGWCSRPSHAGTEPAPSRRSRRRNRRCGFHVRGGGIRHRPYGSRVSGL